MLRAFVAATQHKCFGKAAASFDVTTGSISKAIAKLEVAVQTRLLHRTTSSVTLTKEAQTHHLSSLVNAERSIQMPRIVTHTASCSATAQSRLRPIRGSSREH